MSAQDLEQRARELLPELPPMAMTITGADADAGHWYRAEQMRDYATSAIVAALRQQPAPVDLEQFREAVECWKHHRSGYDDPEAISEANHLLSIIDNAVQVECATCGGRGEVGGHTGQTPEQFDYVTEPCPKCAHQPAPVDDAMVNRAVAATAHPRTTCLDHYEYAEAVIVAALASAQGVQP